MRPDNLNKRDVIDAVLDKSWENPPAHMEQQLMAIPSQIVLTQNRQLDRISIILNSILMFWGVGLGIFFWSPLERLVNLFSQNVLGVSASVPQMLMHPLIGIITLTCLLFGWVLMDMEKHPGVTKV
ncbi:MAG: hypothetical protein HOB84_10855 [Candidatus Marinimicrobia bacterium]|jgi:hypothetical protein|nr:hypothetical protein [Candidatus Neomarinimicrobiota bacterium]MBT4033567.1 hypothetical protein [Candidatus Neomarinimicrobiota bacterium]MBT4360214.1 hypothetical protein [Candidatus Neomarinimicrobiota bacterium]MBT4715262.1 hypothetical protein [Candidatus Neomarinimicrobiota bacterium]MBT4947905.1 hypothetical protein [Candidatus Neomarinimicrobiota bacterium]